MHEKPYEAPSLRSRRPPVSSHFGQSYTRLIPFRDQHQECPRCHEALNDTRLITGDTGLQCKSCDGLFLPLAVFKKLASVFADSLAQLERRPRQSRALACPLCRAPMSVIDVGRVEIDRCEDHGIWFDSTELSSTLTALFNQSSD